jgi:dGTPase
VAQIARTAAAALGLDEDLTEALALVHDIGHPPFAHAGEAVLDLQMRRHGESFDHNLHALRIVESFEQRYARFPGLNLTFEVREGIIKHSRDFAPGERSEAEEYLPGRRPPLEAQLIDLADEIAYNTADLDDAFSGRMLAAEEVAAAVPFYGEIYEAVGSQFPGASERQRFYEALRRLIDSLVTGLIEGTVEAARRAGVKDTRAVRGHPQRIAAFTAGARSVNACLKRFLHARVYSAPELAEDRRRSTAVLGELFAFFLECPERLPEPYFDLTRSQPAHRVICDYLAGMTDAFCVRTHQQLLSPPP